MSTILGGGRSLRHALLRLLAVLALTAAPAVSQTVVTGTIQTPSGNPSYRNVTVHFQLLYCGSNQPKVNGVSLVGGPTLDAKVNSSGQVTDELGAVLTLKGNDIITCGTTLGGTRWQWNTVINGVPGPTCRQNIAGASWDLNSNLCDNATPAPLAPASADTTHLRTDGGNQMAGNIVPDTNGTRALGSLAAFWKLFANAVKLNGIRFADQFSSLSAAISDGSGSDVYVPNTVTTWTGGSVPAYTTVTFQGGNRLVAVSAPVTLGRGAKIICQQGVNLSNVTPAGGTVLDFSAAGLTSQNGITATFPDVSVHIEGCTIKMGNTGQYGIALLGASNSTLRSVTVIDPGKSCFYGAPAGDHLYDVLGEQLTCIHPGAGGVGFDLRTDENNAANADIDRFTCFDCKVHSVDPGQTTEVNDGGIRLQVGTGAGDTIADVAFYNAHVLGAASGGYAVLIKKASGSAYFKSLHFSGLYEEVNNAPNSGTAIKLDVTAADDVQGLFIPAAITGFSTLHNITCSNAQTYFVWASLGNVQPEFCSIQFRSPAAAVSQAGNAPTTSGPVFASSAGGSYQFYIANDGILHYKRLDVPSDLWSFDGQNNQIFPSTDNTGKLGLSGNRWSEGHFVAIAADSVTSSNATVQGSHGESVTRNGISEEITLSTSGTTTDSTANLLPATSRIEAVDCRVTVTITTATDWSVGDGTTAARLGAANATMTAGTTSASTGTAWTTGIASATTGMKQTAAAKLRITTTGIPGAGKIRCTVFYAQDTPPTS